MPKVHKGVVKGLLENTSRVIDINNVMSAERVQAEEDACEAIKATLLISGADKQRYRNLKNDLTNNYLLGTDQYPNMFDKALRILRNYQTSKPNLPFS